MIFGMGFCFINYLFHLLQGMQSFQKKLTFLAKFMVTDMSFDF